MKSEFEQNADYRDKYLIDFLSQLYCKFSNTRELLKNNHNHPNLKFFNNGINSNNNKIDKSKLTDRPVCIIIGPEGDFSEAEREKILGFKGVQPFKINENILRSETAVISAISIVNYVIN